MDERRGQNTEMLLESSFFTCRTIQNAKGRQRCYGSRDQRVPIALSFCFEANGSGIPLQKKRHFKGIAPDPPRLCSQPVIPVCSVLLVAHSDSRSDICCATEE